MIDQANPGHYLTRFTNVNTDALALVPSIQLVAELDADDDFNEEWVVKIAVRCLKKLKLRALRMRRRSSLNFQHERGFDYK